MFAVPRTIDDSRLIEIMSRNQEPASRGSATRDSTIHLWWDFLKIDIDYVNIM